MDGERQTPQSLDGNPIDHDADGDLPGPDVLFDALANATRRHVLYYLFAEREATVHDIADVLVGWRLSATTVVDAQSHERIVLSLCHVHLPKLADAGLIDYDREANTASLASLPNPVRAVVEYAHRYDATVADSHHLPRDE